MARSRLTTRKTKRASSKLVADMDEDEGKVPDEAKWKTMSPYGLFAISDKDGVKHRFKRGDIATVLPADKSPSDTMEPHEYWVAKILEIRADAGSDDSKTIWVRVKWFYNAQDASDIIKSLDTSHIGKFERLLSLHWDYLLPHSFNEVISISKLHTFPFFHNRQAKLKKKLSTKNAGFVVETKTEEETQPESISTTISATAPISSINSISGIQEKETKDDIEIDLDEQLPIGPDMFYWRYTIDVAGRKINPKPGVKTCVCMNPYSPDSTSLLKGVMIFCPRPSCRTSFHLGCLKYTKKVYIPDDKEIVVPSTTGSSSHARGAARGRGGATQSYQQANIPKGKGKGKAVDDITLENEETPWISPSALRRLTTSSDSTEPIDLLSLLHRPEPSHHLQVTNLLERIYARQLAHYQPQSQQLPTPQNRVLSAASSSHAKPRTSSIRSGKSNKSNGSVVEVEDMLIEDVDGNDGVGGTSTASQNTRPNGGNSSWRGGFNWGSISQPVKSKSTTKTNSRAKRNQNTQVDHVLPNAEKDCVLPRLDIKPLSPTTLLATLFLLPSPFPPSYASITASSSQTPIPATVPSNKTDGMTTTDSDTSTDTRDLLLLASQPLIRGAGYFPYLGPTGNVNLVLEARKLVREALSAVGSLDLSINVTEPQASIKSTRPRGKWRRGRGGGKKPAASTRVEVHNLEQVRRNQAGDDIEAQDEEQWRRVTECVQGVLGGWKKRFVEGGKVLPSDGEIDDGVIVKDGLLLPLPSVTGGWGSKDQGDLKMLDSGAGGDAAVDGELEVEEFGSSLRSGRKRKRVPDDVDRVKKKGRGKGKRKEEGEEDEMLLRVDWACLNCGDLL